MDRVRYHGKGSPLHVGRTETYSLLRYIINKELH